MNRPKILWGTLALATVIIFLFGDKSIKAQSLPVTYLRIENGLSNNSVRCIYQDSDGFMWFGTYDGLNRYDGYDFKVYRNKLNDTNSLPHNYIYAINEDHHHNIWIGTGQGIGIHNKRTSKFSPAFYYPYQSTSKQKVSININAIKTDKPGNIFIGTNGWGLMVQSEGDAVAKQIPFEKKGSMTPYYNVQAILIDKEQRTWLHIEDVGLCRFDYKAKKIVVVNTAIKFGKCLEADDEGNIWIGADEGLYKYSIASNAVIKLYTEGPQKLTSNIITTLSFDKQHQLWIGTEGGGINILNPATQKFNYLLPGEDKNTLSSESAFAIYEDNESRKWIGTLKGGINIIDLHKGQFQTITHNPLNQNSLVYRFVSSFIEDKKQNLWIGTDGGGMSIWNRKQNNFTNFKYDARNAHSLSSNNVTSIKQDDLHNTWIATFGGGINKFNESTGAFEHFKCINDSTGAENKNVWLLYTDREQKLWATTFGNGKLYLFNKQSNRFEAFDQNLNDLIAIAEDRSGTLWAGNSYELNRIDKKNMQHASYEIGKPIRAIYEDKRGSFWLGTEGGGLILFNRQQGKITSRFSVDDGLCNNSVLNIVEDGKGFLWLSTFNGLSKFDPVKKTFKNYFQSDGLQSNQFLFNAAMRLHSGELVFGGINGFNIFHPDSLRTRNHGVPVLLTDLRVNNLPVKNTHAYVTKITADKIAELTIPYNEAAIAFDFVTIEFSSPNKIQYAYLLQGWDRGWTYTGNLRTANYTHLREGTYTLRVKSTDAEGIWNQPETRLKIIVLPPWYRTWWAYLFYASIIAVIIYFYLKYKASQTKLKYEIKLAQLNAEKEKEINEKKLSFFTNVSHEFRTPLTLIINPARELLEHPGENGTVQDNIQSIYRNSRRLLSLVDQLLLFKKADSDADKLVLSHIDFEMLCKEVYSCFLQQAKANKITYELNFDDGEYNIVGDKEKIEIILFNLVSNALKYTPEGGKVIISITESREKVQVAVSDTGQGISEAVGNKLYERFYRDETVNRFSKVGFGIGLFLTKHFIDIHKGDITYKSELGKGTIFFVSLLKGNSHFDQHTAFNPFPEGSVMLKELIEEPHENIPTTQLEDLVTDRQAMLVIDDDMHMRQYIASLFHDKFVVYQAENGEEGLAIAHQNIPNIILSDINMSNIDGMHLCRTIKASPALRHIPVILLTGSSSKETLLQSAELGADDFITKPFERDFLVARVGNLLKSHQNLQKYFYNEITHQENNLNIGTEYKEFLEKCIAMVEKHLSDDEFNIKMLAKEIGVSHSTLYKKIKTISGQSATAFIRYIRLRKAAEMFINTNHNINETAFYVGIKDLKYFREQFFKTFGMRPSQYIEKYRKTLGKNYKVNEKVIKDRE
ncbi:MAG: two-component regulator propeller domain-containing protein [Ferruginibacter sp.]